jgi:hypothetical protein
MPVSAIVTTVDPDGALEGVVGVWTVASQGYSTVTDLARFLGLSMSWPSASAA